MAWQKPTGLTYTSTHWGTIDSGTIPVALHWVVEGQALGAWCADNYYYDENGKRKSLPAPLPNIPIMTVGGTKHDTSKPPLSLIPVEALNAVADVLAYGAKKYGKGNYKAGFKQSRLLDAALRHLTAYASKEDKDPESGLSHLGHAAASIAMLLQNIATGVAEDDR